MLLMTIMMNYFTPMDPMSSYFFSNWISFMLPLLIMSSSSYLKSSRLISLTLNIKKLLKTQMYPIIKLINTPSFIIPFLSIFFLIFLLNFSGLFPHMFTPTTHMTLNFSMSFSFWLSLILYAWINNTNFMMIHLIPENTPSPLIPFMISIEIISQMIRPLTLSVRLTTNMIAGHLMMNLLSSLTSFLSLIPTSVILIPLSILIILESTMALIQAYIFMILLSLYSKEMN